VRDCGSVNGTMLNGVKIADPVALHPGDRIALGDSEVVFHSDEDSSSKLIAIDSDSHAKSLAIAMDEEERGTERTRILNSLALEFLGVAEDSGLMRPIGEWTRNEAFRTAARWHHEHPEWGARD